MSNQWGRDNQVTRGRSSSGLLLPIVLCLALIGAGGYFWFARQTMQTDIAALTAQTASLQSELKQAKAERDKASSDLLNVKKNSGTWAEQLEKDYAELKLNEVPKLTRLLDKRDADIAALEKQISAEKSAATSASDDFKAEIAGLTAQLDTAKTESAGLRAQIEGLGAEKLALDTQITTLNAALEKAKADMVTAQKALAQTATDAGNTSTAKSALDLARDAQIKTLEQSLSGERRTVATLRKQLADQADAAARTAAETPANTQPAIDAGPPVEGGRLVPRDRQVVDTIIGTTRGVGFLNDEKKQRLKDQLVSGACVTDALESVFDRVPLVLMRNLMRDFKSDC